MLADRGGCGAGTTNAVNILNAFTESLGSDAQTAARLGAESRNQCSDRIQALLTEKTSMIGSDARWASFADLDQHHAAAHNLSKWS